MFIFDLEADGLLRDATRIHCLTIEDTETGRITVYNGQGNGCPPIAEGIARLAYPAQVCGHNILGYDIPLIEKLNPTWIRPNESDTTDTLVVARLLYPELGDSDDRLIKLGRLKPKYRGAHKLEAWGARLGVLKGEFDGPWEAWTQEMQDYNVQDVVVTHALLKHLRKRPWPTEAVALENAVRRIVSRQERYGFPFDEAAALELLKTLSIRRLELEQQLKSIFGSWYAPKDGWAKPKLAREFTPKGDNKKLGYTAGSSLTKVSLVEFNPASRHHIAKVMQERFGWKPASYTPSGLPEVSEEALKAIRHPEAALLLDYLTVEKRLGSLAEGKEALLKHVRNGRIHGAVNTNDAVTGRMTHAKPNVAQTPAVYSPYGREFRSLFTAPEGMVLVGADAASLELRVMAHFLARYDGGAYGRAAVDGKKEDGTDVHSINAQALGGISRDDAKTWFYAFIYGAGDEKLGSIITKEKTPAKNKRIGRERRAAFMSNLAAMGKLIEAIKAKALAANSLRGLDGRTLFVRSAHAAPNTLFQSAGALVMKKALVILDTNLQEGQGYVPSVDYEFLANVHDEWQIAARPDIASEVGRLAVQAIREAGEHFGFRCPLDGEFRVGRTWADTH